MKNIRRATAIAAAGALSVVGLVGLSSSASAVVRTCNHHAATIIGSGDVMGTAGDDVIILVGAGTVHAGMGNDIVCGSLGADQLWGGRGDDMILAGGGADVGGGAGASLATPWNSDRNQPTATCSGSTAGAVPAGCGTYGSSTRCGAGAAGASPATPAMRDRRWSGW